MKPIVLYRRRTDDWEQAELKICKKYFDVSESRVGLQDRPDHSDIIKKRILYEVSN
jgi:hypothetical protein